jgi:hypothetical protein
MRTQLLLLLCIAAAPVVSQAQSPPPPPPPGKLDPKGLQLPSGDPTAKYLSIEVVSAAPAVGGLKYKRAGLKPSAYRIGSNPQMTDAVWKTFTEGATTTATVNGRTVYSGTMSDNGPLGGPTSGCPSGHFRVRAFLQFRSGTPSAAVLSNIKGDSTCISMGG